MNIQQQLAAAAVAKANKRNGVSSPAPQQATAAAAAPKKKPTSVVKQDENTKNAAKNAAAAAIAAKLGNKSGGLPPPTSHPQSSSQRSNSNSGGSSGGGQLSAEEAKVAAQYVKMMKIGMPEAAVRHKMTGDGVPNHIQDAVIRGDAVAATSSTSSSNTTGSRSGGGARGTPSSLSPEEEQMAAQYRKMMKIGMPEGAVRHKMTTDGVPSHVQEAVFAGDASSGTGGSGGGGSSHATSTARTSNTSSNNGQKPSSLSIEDENIATQYRKMMKIGMPEGAVAHKMNSDKVPAHIQKSVLAGESAPPSSSSSSSVSGPTSAHRQQTPGASYPVAPGGKVSSLSPKDEQIATQYRKMIKMRMPEGAVAHKMNIDRVPGHIQKSVLAGELPAPTPAALPKEDESNIDPSSSIVRPANPMAAIIASSGGLSSLKKVAPPPAKKTQSPETSGRPSNPLAAAIAASGGKGSLKKAPRSPEKPKSESSSASSSGNPLLAELSAGGFKGALRKAGRGNPKYRPQEESVKPNSNSSLNNSATSIRSEVSLNKTSPPPVAAAAPRECRPPPEASSNDTLGSQQRAEASATRKIDDGTSQPSAHPSSPASSPKQRKVKVISKNPPTSATAPKLVSAPAPAPKLASAPAPAPKPASAPAPAPKPASAPAPAPKLPPAPAPAPVHTPSSKPAPTRSPSTSTDVLPEKQSGPPSQRKVKVISKSPPATSKPNSSMSISATAETSTNKNSTHIAVPQPPMLMEYSPMNGQEKRAERTTTMQPLSPVPATMEYSPPTPQHKSPTSKSEISPNQKNVTSSAPAMFAPPPLSELAAAKPQPVPKMQQKPRPPAETTTVATTTVLESGHVEISKATVTTDGTKTSRSSKRVRKVTQTEYESRKTDEKKKTKTVYVDDEVDTHCEGCVIQ